MCVKAEKIIENNLTWYFGNSNERLMAGVRKIESLESEVVGTSTGKRSGKQKIYDVVGYDHQSRPCYRGQKP